MANGNRDTNFRRNAATAKKADIIIDTDKEISRKIDLLSADLQKSNAKLENAFSRLEGARSDGALNSRQLTEVYTSLRDEINSVKKELRYIALQNEKIFSELSRQIQSLSAGQPVFSAEQPAQPAQPAVPAEIDYKTLAENIVGLMPAQEVISPDYIASKVAEQIVLPDYTQAAQVAAEPATAYAASAVARMPVDLQLDEEELADRIALKARAVQPEDFDIIVDDDGCASIANELAERLNYNVISASVAEKLSSIPAFADGLNDYEEMAARISEKITVAGVNEEAIADKAAAALSGYLPEVDVDEIADKVVSQVLENLPAVDSEAICSGVSEKLIESQEKNDYDIVIDEEGIEKITEYVSGEVMRRADARFDDVEKQISEIKAMLLGGAVLREVAASNAEEASLVTVSDLVDEEDSRENSEISEMVEEIDEKPSNGEIMPDGFYVPSGGVDFEHMMKYNRSFIARIIQSTDEQKQYYGAVKTALLSYAKVNSNVAWSNERFNKGRETIARFKIRGKTLCLYLALDPGEYKTSVYHHVDVTDNKSMHGTPMMVKIKSPLGVKKAVRLIDEMLEKRGGIKRNKVIERDYASMYPYETTEELIEDGLIKDVGAEN